ncbi:hypothetical protein [Aliikangiella sp. IMCC44632]
MMKYDKENIQSVIDNLSNIIVSLDRIGGAASDLPENEWKEATIEYLVESNALERLADCRYILEMGRDEESLEASEIAKISSRLESASDWKLSEYKSKRGL